MISQIRWEQPSLPLTLKTQVRNNYLCETNQDYSFQELFKPNPVLQYCLDQIKKKNHFLKKSKQGILPIIYQISDYNTTFNNTIFSNQKIIENDQAYLSSVAKIFEHYNMLIYNNLLVDYDKAFDFCVDDAITRFQKLNKVLDYNIKPAEQFLSALRLLNPILLRLTFYEDGVKARFSYGQKEFVADYNYEEANSIFISTFVNDILVVKDGTPDALPEILGRFNV
jgi:hypothetical protein